MTTVERDITVTLRLTYMLRGERGSRWSVQRSKSSRNKLSVYLKNAACFIDLRLGRPEVHHPLDTFWTLFPALQGEGC